MLNEWAGHGAICISHHAGKKVKGKFLTVARLPSSSGTRSWHGESRLLRPSLSWNCPHRFSEHLFAVPDLNHMLTGLQITNRTVNHESEVATPVERLQHEHHSP